MTDVRGIVHLPQQIPLNTGDLYASIPSVSITHTSISVRPTLDQLNRTVSA